MPGTFDLGPYYRTSRRAMESQRRALGYPSMSPEAIAGERYGELSAYLTDERARREAERLNQFRQQQIGLQYAQLRNQQKAAKGVESGYTMSGIATLAGVADKLGLFGGAKKALTGLLGRPTTPAITTTGTYSPDTLAAYNYQPAYEVPNYGMETGPYGWGGGETYGDISEGMDWEWLSSPASYNFFDYIGTL